MKETSIEYLRVNCKFKLANISSTLPQLKESYWLNNIYIKSPGVDAAVDCLSLSPCSSDELHAYLKHCRPDLCILEGGEEEGEVDRDEEEFVLIEDKEEEEEDGEVCHRHRSSGDDWEVSGLDSVTQED